MNYAVDVENLSVDYESHLVLDNITWRVETGSLAAVIGTTAAVNRPCSRAC